jgi:HPt (histidine-containing phosphotransfer) domain-containing protein
MIDKKMIKQNTQVFGNEKMLRMFKLFIENYEDRLLNAKADDDRQEMRLFFHSLKSASLVFGMKKLAGACSKIEDRILDGKEVHSKELSECVKVYDESVKAVADLLG